MVERTVLNLAIMRMGFGERDQVANIPGWPYEIGDEICVPADLATKWNLSSERSTERAMITSFYANKFDAMIFVEHGLLGEQFWQLPYVQWTPREALRKITNWIDQVPRDISERISTVLDREEIGKLLRGEPDSMSYAAAISAALEWVDELPEEVLASLPDFPRSRIEDGRDHPLALLQRPHVADDRLCNARFDSPDPEHMAWVREQDVKFGRIEPVNDKERALRQGVLDQLAAIGANKSFDAVAVASGGAATDSIRIGANTAEALHVGDEAYTVEVALVDGRLVYYGSDGKHPYLPKEQADELAKQVNIVGAIDPGAWIDGSGYPLGVSASARRELEEERSIEDERSGLDSYGM